MAWRKLLPERDSTPQGTIYILHFDPPVSHARHYVGFTRGDVQRRLKKHRSGWGGKLVAAAVAQGCTITIAWTSVGSVREEYRIKNCGAYIARRCTICRPTYLARRRAREEESTDEAQELSQ